MIIDHVHDDLTSVKRSRIPQYADARTARCYGQDREATMTAIRTIMCRSRTGHAAHTDTTGLYVPCDLWMSTYVVRVAIAMVGLSSEQHVTISWIRRLPD